MEKNPTIKSFRDLRVWQAGMDLVEQVYLLTRTFPKHEVYGLAGQMQRAAISIPSNIAEGHTREHLKEYLQHLSIARSSLAELETQLEIAARLQYCTPEQLHQLFGQLDALGRQLSSLRNVLAKPAPNT
ncbi:MAG TPA: four helix bundle protein [Candidatus Binatia bacterium]|nr:four helix bundle protein [Candidatus Binatia bacterium]